MTMHCNKTEMINVTIDLGKNIKAKPQKDEIGHINNRLKKVHQFKTVSDLAERFVPPYSNTFAVAMYNGNRKKENWASQQVFALDFDSGVPPEVILKRLTDIGITVNIIYATFSDSPELRKFRVVAILDSIVTDQKLADNLTKGLIRSVDLEDLDDYVSYATADEACKDVSRMYFGGKELLYLNEKLNKASTFIATLMPFFPPKKAVTPTVRIARGDIKIDGSKAHRIALNYTLDKVGEYVQGQRHHFIITYAALMNQFGAPYETMLAEIKSAIPVTGDSIAAAHNVYITYADQFATKTAEAVFYTPSLEKVDYTLSATQKLSDLNIAPATLDNKILVSPTASGKTYYVAHLEGKKILVTPTRSLSDEVAARYNGKAFNAASKDVSNEDDFIVVTYASYQNLITRINVAQYRVFIDEAHNFTTSASSTFMLKELNALLNTLKVAPAKSTTLLTATPLLNADPYLSQFEYVNVVKNATITKNFKVLNVKDKTKAVSEIFGQAKANGEFTAVLLNNTKSKLTAYLATLTNYNIQTFSAAKKNEDYFVELMKNGQIQSDVDGIISTTVLKEGNSIFTNKAVVNVVIASMFSVEEIEQFAARFRDATTINVFVLRPFDTVNKTNTFNSQSYADDCVLQAKSNAQALNELNLNVSGVRLESIMDVLASSYTKVNGLGFYDVDYLAISNKVYEMEKVKVWGDIALLNAKAHLYGFSAVTIEAVDTELTEEEKVAQKAAIEELKATLEAKTSEVVEMIMADGLDANVTLVDTCEDAFEQKIRYKFAYIYKYVKNPADVINIFSKVAKTTNSWNTFVKQVMVAHLEANGELAERCDYKFVKALRAKVSVGATYTQAELHQIVLDAYSENIPYKSLDKLTAKKATKFVGLIFDIAVSRKRLEGSEKITMITINSDTALPFSYDQWAGNYCNYAETVQNIDDAALDIF